MRLIANSVWNDGAHAPPSNFQTGMPSFLALSARFAEMPEPGNTMTPIGTTASIWSLRRNGAALAWRVQSGLKAICVTLRALAQAAAMRSAPFGLAAALGGNEVAAVDHCGREGAVVDHRPGARAPG